LPNAAPSTEKLTACGMNWLPFGQHSDGGRALLGVGQHL
jgi:hypothetical protein